MNRNNRTGFLTRLSFVHTDILTISLWGFLLTVIGNLLIHQNASLIDRMTNWLSKFDDDESAKDEEKS